MVSSPSLLSFVGSQKSRAIFSNVENLFFLAEPTFVFADNVAGDFEIKYICTDIVKLNNSASPLNSTQIPISQYRFSQLSSFELKSIHRVCDGFNVVRYSSNAVRSSTRAASRNHTSTSLLVLSLTVHSFLLIY